MLLPSFAFPNDGRSGSSVSIAPRRASFRRHRIVNAERVEQIWRREGLKISQKQPKRGRLWLPPVAPRPPTSCPATQEEWLLRELHLEALRRAPRWRNLLLAEGDPDRRRRMAAALQYGQFAFIAGLQNTYAGSNPVTGV